MKKLIGSLALLLFLTGLVLAVNSEKEVYIPFKYVEPQEQYVPNSFVIEFKPISDRFKSPSVTAIGTFGIAELDALGSQFGVSNVRPEFAGAKPQPTGSTIPDLTRYYIVDFSESYALADVMSAFANNPLVDHVEPIGIHPIDLIPNDTYFPSTAPPFPSGARFYQWYLNQASDEDSDNPCAWDINTGSPSKVVGILDTGTRYYHKDLGGANWTGGPSATGTTGNIWINTLDAVDSSDNDGNGFVDDHIGWDFVTGISGCASGEDCSTPDNDPADFNGHGTHVAGLASAITNNSRSIAGIAGGFSDGTINGVGNGVKVMVLRIGWQDQTGNGFVNMAFAAQALNYLTNINNNPGQTAKVVAVNCSWGSSNSGGIQAALDAAEAAGVLICKSAGNSNNQNADFINSRATTMSVAATDSLDRKASFSSFGTWVDVSAAGNEIISTWHQFNDPGPDYVAVLSGTSMSTPLVTGLAGLVKSQFPSLTRQQVYDQIKNTTDNIDSKLQRRHRGKMGTGRINACRALGGTPSPKYITPGDEPVAALPKSLELEQNYPNPFNLSTSISFSISEKGMVSLSIYNIKGQKVKTLVDGVREPGIYTINWDGTNHKGDVVASGIYLYQLLANDEIATAKMSLLK